MGCAALLSSPEAAQLASPLPDWVLEHIKMARKQTCQLGGFEWRRFATLEELDVIAGTLYDVYVGEQKWDPVKDNPSGIIVDHAGKTLTDHFHANPKAHWIGVTRADQPMQLLGFMRLVEHDAIQAGKFELGLYREDLVKEFQDGLSVEANRLCLTRAGRANPGGSMLVTRALVLATAQYGVEELGTNIAFGTQDIKLATYLNKLGALQIDQYVQPFKYNESEPGEVVMVQSSPRFIASAAAGAEAASAP